MSNTHFPPAAAWRENVRARQEATTQTHYQALLKTVQAEMGKLCDPIRISSRFDPGPMYADVEFMPTVVAQVKAELEAQGYTVSHTGIPDILWEISAPE